MGTVYKLKIDDQGNTTKAISIIRKFDSSLSIGEIKRRITDNDYVVHLCKKHINFFYVQNNNENMN